MDKGEFDEDEDQDGVESQDEAQQNEDIDNEDSEDANALVFMIMGVTADGTIVSWI